MKELIEILERRKECDKIAIKDSEGNTIKYTELYRSSIALARMLDGVEASEKVLVNTGNVVEYAIALFGIWGSGRVAVVVNEQYKYEEIVAMADFCESNVLISSKKSKIQGIDEIENSIYPMIVSESISGEYTYKNNKLCFIGTTSGTTSMPKCIMLSTEGVIEQVINISRTIQYGNILRELMLLPVSSVSMTIAQLLLCLYLGEEIVIFSERFNIPRVLQVINEEEPNYIVCTNSILALIVYSKKVTLDILEKIEYIVIAGEPADKKLMKQLREQNGKINVMQAYGLTETSGLISWYTYNDEAPIDSVGKVMSNFKIRVALDNSVLGRNRVGEIEVLGKSVMKGYYRNDELTKEVFKDGWFKTGDLGYLDENNFLYIKGRKKRVIIVSGKNVYAEEVEEILKRHCKVAMAKVYSKKDDWMGEQIIADIVPIGNVSEYEIIDYCKKNMKTYMCPKKIYIVKQLEITENSKMKCLG